MNRARISFFPEDQAILKSLLSDFLAVLRHLGKLDQAQLRLHPEVFARATGHRDGNDIRAEMRSTRKSFHRFDNPAEIADAFAAGLVIGFDRVLQLPIDSGTAKNLTARMLPSLSKLHVAQLARTSDFDRLLIAAGAPNFEFAVAPRYPNGFDFQWARDAFSALPANWADSLDETQRKAFLQAQIIQPSWRRLEESVNAGRQPAHHDAILVADLEGKMVGVTFRHSVHLGIIPGLCMSPEDLTAMMRNLIFGTQAQSQLPSDQYGWAGFGGGMGSDGRLFGAEAQYRVISVDNAYSMLTKLDAARDGERVQAAAGEWSRLLNARIVSQTIGHGGGPYHYKTVQFALEYSHHGPAPSTMMSVSGEAGWNDGQQYIRQQSWLDEDDFRTMFPSGRHLEMPSDVFWHWDISKIVPEHIRDFQERAEAMVDEITATGNRTKAFLDAKAKIAAQRERIKRIDAHQASTDSERKRARIQGFAWVENQIIATH